MKTIEDISREYPMINDPEMVAIRKDIEKKMSHLMENASNMDINDAVDALDEFIYTFVVYGLTKYQYYILEESQYTCGMKFVLGNTVKYKHQLELFAVILHKYYNKSYQIIFNDLVKKEEYEICAMINNLVK